MRTIYHLLFLTLLGLPLVAQRVDINSIDSFELSAYRARYERRPLMAFNPRLNLSRTENSFAAASTSFSGSFAYDWRLRRLKDEFIEEWMLTTSPNFRWRDREDDNWGLPLEVSYNRQQFYRPQRFYGYQAGLGFVYNQILSNGANTATLSPPINLALFVGGGRIEYAEDALLAAWTLKDLEVAGILPRTVAAEEVYALARTITDLVGNRVFDVRRRRIYELEQLHATVQSFYPELPMSIELFTIVNDNWAFANRVTLPYGNEWRIGPQAANRSNLNFEAGERTSTRSTKTWGGFASWRRARVHNNRTATDLNVLLQGEKYDQSISFGDNDFVISDDFRSQLQLSYGYSWFPFSRSLFRGTASLGYNHWWDTNNAWTKSAAYWEGSLSADADIFLSYQWNLNIGLGINGSYFPEQKEAYLSPRVTVRSLYSIF